MKGLSELDRKQIQDAEEMLGPDPSEMGFIKNIFWGNFKTELAFPYPTRPHEEVKRCDALLENLDNYLKTEHPTIEIDQKEEIPESVIRKLFELQVMGMIIPQEYGGGGFSITSYNRVLERIGMTCGSTAVMVSAHQSIGCGAITLFGTEKQKAYWLPRIAKNTLSAFCLSEPNVGCDAGGQNTRCELSPCGTHYILNGEKKWSTSGALSGMLTVMCKQKMFDSKTGKQKDKVTALIVTPEMEGIEIFSRNRSKCGIRGTWQARIRFTNVKVPAENLLHKEGKGLNVALTCLNYGRCTLSAGMVGAGRSACDQAIAWSKYRYQFGRPIGEFDLVKGHIADMSALCYAMEAMLYLTTGIVDRKDEDIMLETAICKVFCSHYGFEVTDRALQIMGGEGYVTENEIERLWRDSRINKIVEGANEVMHSFVFAYGSKQLGEYMLGIRSDPFNPKHIIPGIEIASQLFLGISPKKPKITALDSSLLEQAERYSSYISRFTHEVKRMFKEHEEKLVTNQFIQERLSWASIWLHAIACILSRLDQSIRHSKESENLTKERAIANHAISMGYQKISDSLRSLYDNTDEITRTCAEAIWKDAESMNPRNFYLPEGTPHEEALSQSRKHSQIHIRQFGEGSMGTEGSYG